MKHLKRRDFLSKTFEFVWVKCLKPPGNLLFFEKLKMGLFTTVKMRDPKWSTGATELGAQGAHRIFEQLLSKTCNVRTQFLILIL